MSVFCCIAVCVLVVLVGEEGCLHVRDILLFACGKNVFGIHVWVFCVYWFCRSLRVVVGVHMLHCC